MQIQLRPAALLPLAMALVLATPGHAQQATTNDPEVRSLVCDLSGDCAADDAAPAASGGARSSATRGFTFKRTAPDAAAGAALAAAAAPKPVARRALSADLHHDFASATAELNPAARARLAKLASALSTPRLSGRRVRIEGHTDANGSAAANRALSQRRAQAAADYLVSAGVPRVRLEVMGYGSAQPLPDMPATAPQNRRVMATILN
ncbi:MAG: OmpA family protein [Sphingomonas sp.]